MPDKEKVIKGLRVCISHDPCNDCPYAIQCYTKDKYFREQMLKDALALLEDQEERREVLK